MTLKLAARFVVLEPSKIADLQENDTVTHILDLSSILPVATIGLLLVVERVSGAGYFHVFPRSHATLKWQLGIGLPMLMTIKDQELKWKNTAANDDWDLYLLGYFVQPRTR